MPDIVQILDQPGLELWVWMLIVVMGFMSMLLGLHLDPRDGHKRWYLNLTSVFLFIFCYVTVPFVVTWIDANPYHAFPDPVWIERIIGGITLMSVICLVQVIGTDILTYVDELREYNSKHEMDLDFEPRRSFWLRVLGD